MNSVNEISERARPTTLMQFNEEPPQLVQNGRRRNVRFPNNGVELHEFPRNSALSRHQYKQFAHPGIILLKRFPDPSVAPEVMLSHHVSGYLAMHRSLQRYDTVLVLQLSETEQRTLDQCWDILTDAYLELWKDSDRLFGLGSTVSPARRTLAHLVVIAARFLAERAAQPPSRKQRSAKFYITGYSGDSVEVVSEALKFDSVKSLSRDKQDSDVQRPEVPQTRAQLRLLQSVSNKKETVDRVVNSAAQELMGDRSESDINASRSPEPRSGVTERQELLWGRNYLPDWTPDEKFAGEPVKVTPDLEGRILKFGRPAVVPYTGRIDIAPDASGYFTNAGLVLLPGGYLNAASDVNEATRAVKRFQTQLLDAGYLYGSGEKYLVVKPLLIQNVSAAFSLVAGYIDSYSE